MIGVAIDENLEKLRELTADVDFPILVDADHVLTELYHFQRAHCRVDQ